MPRSAVFNIQHIAGGRFIHPKGGVAEDYEGAGFIPLFPIPLVIPTGHHRSWLVTYDSTGPQTQFYFDYIEWDAPWGYLVWARDPRWCVHPEGGEVYPGNNAGLHLHTDRHRGAYFKYNTDSQTFQHIGGRYWHPRGGMAHPSNNNGILLYEGYRDETKFRLTDAAGNPTSLELHGQDGWFRCGHCAVLHYSKGASRCQATQAAHQPEGTNYTLFQDPQPGNFQPDWRWCRKCGTLHYRPRANVCPAGDTHDATGSGNYSIRANVGEWHWCKKCGALHLGATSVCPAGGAHASEDSAGYSLEV